MMNRCLMIAGIACLLVFCQCSDTYESGQRIYKTYCANCHMDSGEGLGALIPPLAGSDYLAKNQERLPCIVRYGLQDTIVVNGKTYSENMAGMPGLSDIQITNLLNYINHAWGNEGATYQFEQVQELLKKCQ